MKSGHLHWKKNILRELLPWMRVGSGQRNHCETTHVLDRFILFLKSLKWKDFFRVIFPF